MLEWIHVTWSGILEGRMLDQWVEHFPKFAAAIRRQANLKSQAINHTNVFPETFNIFGFVDCNCTPTSLPGTGPDGRGPGKRRKDPGGLVQRGVYNKWKARHGVKVPPTSSSFNVPDSKTLY